MTEYQYCTIKYIHDYSTGEFVNLGIILFDPSTNYFDYKITQNFQRVQGMFHDVDLSTLAQNLNTIKSNCSNLNKDKLEKFQCIHTIISAFIMTIDNSSLTFSDIKKSLLLDKTSTQALDTLFYNLVTKYMELQS